MFSYILNFYEYVAAFLLSTSDLCCTDPAEIHWEKGRKVPGMAKCQQVLTCNRSLAVVGFDCMRPPTFSICSPKTSLHFPDFLLIFFFLSLLSFPPPPPPLPLPTFLSSSLPLLLLLASLKILHLNSNIFWCRKKKKKNRNKIRLNYST